MLNISAIETFIKQYQFNEREIEYLNETLTEDYIPLPRSWCESMLFEDWCLDSHLDVNDNDTHSIANDSCATNLIETLFDHYDNEKTLLAISNAEHINVQNVAHKHNRFNNLVIVDHENEIVPYNTTKLLKQFEKGNYNTLFFYCIGTQLSTGIITRNYFFEKLREEFNKKFPNKNLVIALDDVQGMYLVPRDYSIFDYVINTGHSVVPPIDLGICFYRKDHKEVFSSSQLEMDRELSFYCSRLSEVLKPYRFGGFQTFRMVMMNVFEKVLDDPKTKLYNRTSNHIFAIRIKDLKFNKPILDYMDSCRIHVENNGSHIGLRFRAQEVMFEPSLILKGLRFLDNVLENYE